MVERQMLRPRKLSEIVGIDPNRELLELCKTASTKYRDIANEVLGWQDGNKTRWR